MKRNATPSKRFALTCAAALMCISSPTLLAQSTYTWTGASNEVWANAANWSGAGTPPPSTVDVARFNSVSPQATVSLGAPVTIGKLEFLSGAGSYTLSGSAITIQNIGSSNFIEHTAGNTQTISSAITLDATLGGYRVINVGAGSTLNLTGKLTATKSGSSSDTNVRVTGGGTLDFAGSLSGVNIFSSEGSGTLLNYRAGTASRLRSTDGGRIDLYANPAAVEVDLYGNGSVFVRTTSTITDGGQSRAINIATSTAGGVLTFGADIAGGGTAKISRNLNLNYGSTLAVADNVTVRLTAAANNVLELSGVISDSKDSGLGTKLQIEGAGKVRLSGTSANTSRMPVVVSGGTLILAKTDGINAIGGGSITLESGGNLELAANNQIADTVSLRLSGGTFKTGSFNETLGMLTVDGTGGVIDLSNAASNLVFSSLGSISGVLTIVGWTPRASIVFLDGANWDATALSFVNFSGYGAASFDAATGTLTAIPEASTVVLFFCSSGALRVVALRRRSKLRVA